MTRIARRRSTALLGVALLVGVNILAAVVSCAPTEFLNAADRGKACASDSECAYYLACEQGLCRQRCSETSDCSSGVDCSQCQCVASVCMPLAPYNSSGYVPPTPTPTPTPTTTATTPPAATCPTTDPVTPADIEGSNPWKPPAPIQSACTQGNINDLRALVAGSGGAAKFADIKTTVGTTCAACVFSPPSGSTWQPVIEFSNGFIQNTFGACLALLETSACGKAAYEAEGCLKFVCPPATCPNQSACIATARTGACRTIVDNLATACPRFSDTSPMCSEITNAVIEVCAGGLDAGVN
jgi:hypothetical protein